VLREITVAVRKGGEARFGAGRSEPRRPRCAGTR
jgi:hypothetical protein